MKVLVACEFSGVVRDAFIARGHDAISCDLLPTERPRSIHLHYQGDVLPLLKQEWDMVIAFPPCTHLACSGAKHFAKKKEDGSQQQGIDFFMEFTKANTFRLAIENPIGIMSKLWRKPDQIIQPWQFGHGETKATCLWLKGLPLLKPTNIVEGREAKVHKCPPGPDRWKIRSRTYQGIADAMASQWGSSNG
jgi:hypothetical protein